jgi:hypothetical protein
VLRRAFGRHDPRYTSREAVDPGLKPRVRANSEWVLDRGWIDQAGHRLTLPEENALMRAARDAAWNVQNRSPGVQGEFADAVLVAVGVRVDGLVHRRPVEQSTSRWTCRGGGRSATASTVSGSRPYLVGVSSRPGCDEDCAEDVHDRLVVQCH